MNLLLRLAYAFFVAWLGIKILKVVLWVVVILVIANLFSATIGLFATLFLVLFMLARGKQITADIVIFICVVLVIGLL